MKVVGELRDGANHVCHHDTGTRADLDYLTWLFDIADVVLERLDHPNSKRFAEHLRNFRRCCEITTFIENFIFRTVVTMSWMTQAKLHESVNRHGNASTLP